VSKDRGEHRQVVWLSSNPAVWICRAFKVQKQVATIACRACESGLFVQTPVQEVVDYSEER